MSDSTDSKLRAQYLERRKSLRGPALWSLNLRLFLFALPILANVALIYLELKLSYGASLAEVVKGFNAVLRDEFELHERRRESGEETKVTSS